MISALSQFEHLRRFPIIVEVAKNAVLSKYAQLPHHHLRIIKSPLIWTSATVVESALINAILMLWRIPKCSTKSMLVDGGASKYVMDPYFLSPYRKRKH